MEAYKFVPFAIERDGAWGSEAHHAFDSIVEAAHAGVDAEAFHWSAMNFERHWRQRVAVALGRGQALIVTQAAERAHRKREPVGNRSRNFFIRVMTADSIQARRHPVTSFAGVAEETS